MKRLFAAILLVLGMTQIVPALYAQGMSPGTAYSLQQRSRAMLDKINSAPKFSFGPGAPGYNENEDKFVNEVLPQINADVTRAGDLFGRAAEILPSAEGDRCVREGCDLLKKTLDNIAYAQRLIHDSGSLRAYFNILNEIQIDVVTSLRDAGCYNSHNPWTQKVFRSTYFTENGDRVDGKTQILGTDGWYETRNGEKGRLEYISFRDNFRVAQGLWRFQNGAIGWFSFTLSHDGRSFHGEWGHGRSIGHQRVAE